MTDRIRVLVVGAAGQVGRVAFRRLAQMPDIEAIGLTRNWVAAAPLAYEGLQVRVGDATNIEEAACLLGDADIVVNCAISGATPRAAREQTELLLQRLVQNSTAHTIIHLSSVAVYGSFIDGKTASFLRPALGTTYAREKFRAEKYIGKLARKSGKRVVVLRLGHVYGREQWLSRLIFELLVDRAWRLPFDGNKPSNAVNVVAFAGAVAHIARHAERLDSGQAYNLFDPDHRTWRDVFDLHAEAARCPPVASEDERASERIRRRIRDEARRNAYGAAIVDIARSLATAGAGAALSSAAVREIGFGILSKLPLSVESRVRNAILDVKASRAADGLDRSPSRFDTTFVWCDGAPGPTLWESLPDGYETPSRTGEAADLEDWYRDMTHPAWRNKLAGPEHGQ